MRRKNFNIIVFCVCFLFIAIGLCTKDMFTEIMDTIKTEVHEHGFDFESIKRVEESIDEISSEKLLYHTQMMDLSSLKENIIGTRVLKNRAKSESGNLIDLIYGETTYENIYETLEKVDSIRLVAEENHANFLYCATPNKEYYESLFENAPAYSKKSYGNLVAALSDRGIPYIDLVDCFRRSDIPESEIFFHTDHHWKPYSGFVVNKFICERLHEKYGFGFDLSLLDKQNYQVDTYKNFFLGSHGRRTGRFFSWYSSDDFDVFTPKFQTDLSVFQSNKSDTRQGSFENTVLYKEHLKKDYYNEDCYNTYCGDDPRLQIIKNNLNPQGEKILIIKDSFARVVIPFLTLQAGELHIVDNRDRNNSAEEKIDIKSYIEEYQPNYVIVLVSGVSILPN